MGKSFCPRKGDAIKLFFGPEIGHEQGGYRPVIVLSPENYNRKTGLALSCPITSHVKGYPFEVVLPEGCGVEGVVIADQIKCLDWTVRKTKFLCRLPDEIWKEVMAKVVAIMNG